MKKLIAFSLLAAATIAAPLGAAAQTLGLSIGINQPGVYGRINIGQIPQPALVYERPVVIQPAPLSVQRQPIYLYVPVAHQQNWARYCGHYGACGQPVYFVHENWVRERYMHEHPQWRQGHDRGHERHAIREVHDNRHGDKHDGRDERR